MRKRPLYLSAIALVVTGAVHATATPAASSAARGAGLDSMFGRALPLMWADFTFVLLVQAALLVYAARHPKRLVGLVRIVAVTVLAQAVVTAMAAGPTFPFVWVLVAAALLSLFALRPLPDVGDGVMTDGKRTLAR